MFALLLLYFTYTISLTSSTTDNASLIASSNHFGYVLTAELYRDIGPGANIWISPFCLCSSFAVLYAGTTPHTNSRLQIADTLRFSSDADDDTPAQTVEHFSRLQHTMQQHSQLYMSHRLYISQRYRVTPAFATTYAPYIRGNFDFDLKDASDAINDWVLNDTLGVIDEVIHRTQDIAGYSALATNVVFVNATFAQPFSAAQTSQQPFFTDIYRSTQRVYVHLMHQMQYFAYFESDEYQFVKFPLLDDDADPAHDLYMLYVLPKRGDVGVISDAAILEHALQNLAPTFVALAFPKLSIQATYRLKSRVKELGIIDIFSDKTAQFAELSVDAEFVVDGILHKTMIQTNEYGSMSATAAAVAAAHLKSSLLRDSQNLFSQPTAADGADGVAVETPEPVLFKADHPFQMYVVDGSQHDAILCMGHIIKPGIPDSDAAVVYDESVDDIWFAYPHLSKPDEGAFLDVYWIVPLLCAVAAILMAVVAYVWHCHQTRKLQIERNVRYINKELKPIPNADIYGVQEEEDEEDEHTVDIEESLE